MRRFYLFLTVVLFLFFSCANNIADNKNDLAAMLILQNLQKKETSNTTVKYGSITINTGNSESRATDVASISRATVTVYWGNKAEEKKDALVDFSGNGKGSVTINEIPVGKNRVIVVEAAENFNNIINKMAGIEISAVTDIKAGNNNITVNWKSTAEGNVYRKLLSSSKVNVENISRDDVQALINENVHSSLIDFDLIAADIINNSKKSADSYVKTAGSVKFTSGSSENNVIFQVCDPASAKLDSIISGVNKISGVTPGTWKVLGLLNDSVIFSKSVDVASGAEVDLGTIQFKTPVPRLEDSTGTQISEFISGSTKVYLNARTYDDETPLSDVVIYYTTDGTEPDASSTKYTSAGISVNIGTTLKAVAISSLLGNSNVSSWTFEKPAIGMQHPETGNYSVASTDTTAVLGANIKGDKTSFVLYSANATKVLLEIYSKPFGDAVPLYDYWMEKDSNNYWRITLNGNLKNAIYAFRCWGPNWTYSDSWTRGGSAAGFVADYDSKGNRFNPNKVLFDPYAKEITHDKSNPTALGTENGGMYGTGAELYNGVERRLFDTAAFASKAYVVNDSTGYGTKPQIPSAAARVYEAHARGLTKHPSSSSLESILRDIDGFEGVQNVPAEYRGTYKGAAYMAPYFKALGINTIEFLPVHESDNDANPDNAPGGNYWAYMTYGYFAPDRRYAYDKSAGGPTREFKEMVKAFHDEGIEVYLDVVYNHTGEGGPWYGAGENEHAGDDFKTAEITFMRGIDNQTYYSLCGTSNKQYWETTGCGNNMQCDNPVVRKFIIDSLTYWIKEMGVDGFRFDLAPVLGREKSGSDWIFNPNATTLTEIGTLGTSNNVEMIAEAWDCQWPGGYNVGKFPAGWGDWNGVYRDVIREYVGGNGTSITKSGDGVNYSMTASEAIWGHNGNGGTSSASSTAKFGVSVNMIDAHDGLNLADLSSYAGAGNSKNNNAWPFGPSDGGNGDTNYIPGSSAEVYRRTARNYIALQMFTRGIPMIVWGDEFSRTQNGNNNPYNIDSVATWNNYNMINTNNPHAVATGGEGTYVNKFGTFNNTANVNGNFIFMQRMLKMHSDPAFNQLTTTAATTTWIPGGTANSFGYITDGTAVGGHKFLMFTNQTSGEVAVSVPAPASGKHWVRICDTGSWAEKYMNSWDPLDTTADNYYAIPAAKSYGVGAYSVLILEEVSDAETCASPSIVGTNMFTTSSLITISCETPGASIYYTTDGTEPTASNGTLYSGAFSITATTTVKAVAVKTGYNNSSVASVKFTKNVPTCANPVISGTTPFTESTSVTISCSTTGAKIYYTTNGTIPTTSSSVYSSPITLTASATVKAIAVMSGMENSEIVSKFFSLQTVSSKSAVMLQGFNWDSAPRGASTYWYKWYDIMANNGTQIGKTFDYVWFPSPCKTNTASSEGYGPTEWFDFNNCYGTETQLKNAISSISPAKAVADIVVNHRDGYSSWGDFANPTLNVVKGSNYKAICSDDEGFTSEPEYMGKVGSNMRGAKDTGATYAASRDLDHTNTDVQNGIKEYLSRLKAVGFEGWRYDFVKGFDGLYVGQYNSASSPSFAVGEYWPGTDDGGGYFSASNPSGWENKIKSWISRTQTGGYKTKAFEFVLKGIFNDIFGCSYTGGSNSASNNFSYLASTATLVNSMPEYAVTFVDNHDTGSTQGHWKLPDTAVPASYAYILTHPGYPCVAWQHYFSYAESGNSSNAGSGQYISGNRAGTDGDGNSITLRELIDILIELRKNLAVECDSSIEFISSSSTCYAAKVTGQNGAFIVTLGTSLYNCSDSDYSLVASGTNYKVWQSGGSSSSKCRTPVITISGGNATITCGTDGATIMYGFSSTEMISTYSASVTMTDGQTIYAYATKDGLEDSGVASKTYTAGKTLTVTADDWTWNSASVFAWVWKTGSTGSWIKCTGSGTTVNVEVPADADNFLLVRCPVGTTTPSWNATGDSPGRIYNKTADIKITSSSSYTVAFVDN